MKDREVFVMGGANSAGQAAVHIATYAARVTRLVRGRSLGAACPSISFGRFGAHRSRMSRWSCSNTPAFAHSFSRR
jgi:hypothetical protein